MNPITTNKNTRKSAQEETHSTIKKHTDAGTQRFRPRKWCQNNTTNRCRRNHLRNCLPQKNLKIRLHHRYTNKNAMTQETLRKKMTNQTLARTTGLPPRPHLHQRHHETTHNTSTNTNRVPLKNKLPEMAVSNLRFTEQHSPVTREFQRNRGSNELFDKDTT